MMKELMKIEKFGHIKCNQSRALFSIDPHQGYLFIDSAKLIQLVEFLIDNIYIKFGDVMHQNIGIPMGTDCAPLLADLFLHYYEYKFINRVMKDKGTFYLAKMFNNTFRYIDDLVCINNHDHLEQNWKNIYPCELILEKDNACEKRATFLDLDIIIQEHGTLKTKLYDKRDAFQFDIVSFPHIHGNIPPMPAYGVYIGELIRIVRTCAEPMDAIERIV